MEWRFVHTANTRDIFQLSLQITSACLGFQFYIRTVDFMTFYRMIRSTITTKFDSILYHNYSSKLLVANHPTQQKFDSSRYTKNSLCQLHYNSPEIFFDYCGSFNTLGYNCRCLVSLSGAFVRVYLYMAHESANMLRKLRNRPIKAQKFVLTSEAKANLFLSPPDKDLSSLGVPILVLRLLKRPNSFISSLTRA